MIKQRIIQPLFMLGMILLNIIYNILLLITWIIILIPSFFWKTKVFWNMTNWFRNSIPEIPEQKKR